MSKKYLLFIFFISPIICQSAMAQSDTARIRHTVIFKLKCAKGSAEEQDFFNAAKKLANIPGVEKFECLK